MKTADELTKELTAWNTIEELCNQLGNYSPCCYVSDPDYAALADFYDAAQEKRGDPRRARRVS